MQTGHANAIKGLSIAVIVIAALGIIGSVIGGVLMGFGSAVINEVGPSAISNAHDHGYHHGLEYEYGLSDQQAASLVAMLMATVGGALSAWVLICHAVVLVAGIIGLRNHGNLPKMGQVMGWAIGGAIASFVGGGFITMILLIVVAVFANSDKKLAAGTYAATAPAYAAPAQPAQAAPAAQPAQAGASAQPAAQPAQPVQPTGAAPAEQLDQPGTPLQ